MSAPIRRSTAERRVGAPEDGRRRTHVGIGQDAICPLHQVLERAAVLGGRRRALPRLAQLGAPQPVGRVDETPDP